MQFQEEPPYNKFDTGPHNTNAGYLLNTLDIGSINHILHIVLATLTQIKEDKECCKGLLVTGMTLTWTTTRLLGAQMTLQATGQSAIFTKHS